MFLGLMIKHQRVQIAPVQVRAAFWVRERDSAGRAKSETPARTRAHWFELAVCSNDTGVDNRSTNRRFQVMGKVYLHDRSPIRELAFLYAYI